MADPEQAWTTRDLQIDGKLVPSAEQVWVHGRSGTWTEIEFRGRRGRVPSDALRDHPVVGPSLEQLRALDLCFVLPDDAFEQTYIDRDHSFEIVRCRAHGSRFLRYLVVNGFAWNIRLTLLSPEDPEDPFQVWRWYRDQPSSWHARHGRTY